MNFLRDEDQRWRKVELSTRQDNKKAENLRWEIAEAGTSQSNKITVNLTARTGTG